MERTKPKRKVSLFMLSILIILIISLVGGGLFLYDLYQKKQSSAKSIYANTPNSVGSLKASDYQFVSFLPVWGGYNSSAPVRYGSNQIIVGNQKDGNAVLASISDDGAARWEVQLGGKLISCARKAIKNEFLPCLYNSPKGNGVSLVNLTNGAAKWIWLSAESYINIAVDESNSIYLMGNDLSLTKIDREGNLLDEVLLAQKTAKKQHYPDTTKCEFTDQVLQASPERMDFLSSSLILLTHRGINYTINAGTGDLLGAIPGSLLASKDKQIYAIAPINDCAPAALLYPTPNNLSLLPQNQSVPIENPLPGLIVKDKRLYRADWQPFRVTEEIFPSVNLKLGSSLTTFKYQNNYILLSDNTLTALEEKSNQKLWSFSDNFQDMSLAGDTLIYSTSYGSIKAVSAKEGAGIWDISTNNEHASFRVEKERLIVASSSQIDYYSFKAADNMAFKGASTAILKSEPGLSYDLGSCIRIVKKDGEKTKGNRYDAYLTKVNCNMNGAQEVGAVITTNVLPKETKPEVLLQECNKTPDMTGVVTVSSPLDDPNLTAICTKKH